MIEAGIFADLDDRLWMDGLGRRLGAWRDRVSPNLAHGRLAFLTSEDPKHVEQRRRLLKHEDGVNELALAFKAAGIPCFVGWRETVTLSVPTELQEMFGWPRNVQIAPDLIVLAGGGTFGNAWHFVEFERTASSRKAVIRKLRGYYVAAWNKLPIPLLMVCETQRAAETFVEYSAGIAMLITTLKDAVIGPLAGDSTVWRFNGEPASIHVPSSDQLLTY